MASLKKALLFGLLVWLIPFIVAFAIYPIHESWRALFESIMPVVIAAAAVTLGLVYFRNVSARYRREGILLGLVWFLICFVIDLFMFSGGPMKMSAVEYIGDVGLTYLMIPLITFGLGAARGMGAR
jgi:uncharacterized membrane protein YjfL (UPF0719 family)